MTHRQLRQIRQRLAMTQTQLAEQLGVTSNSVARWERNEVPIRDSIAKLVRMLEASAHVTTRKRGRR